MIIKLINEYLFDVNLPNTIKSDYFSTEELPKNILVQESFNYFGTFILSIFLYKYEISQIKKSEIHPLLIKNDNNENFSPKNSSIELIYKNKKQNFSISFSFLIITIFLLTIMVQLRNQFYVMDFRGVDFWMCELLFISYITFYMFGIKIYKHQKLAIYFILCLSGIFKILSLNAILNNNEDNEEKIYKIYKWIIPILIIIIIISYFFRDFSICRIKWLLDYKYYSVSKILMIYGLFGFIICIIASIISSNIKCVDKENTFEYIDLICTVNITNNDDKTIIYYYDNFNVYFRDLWKSNRSILINFLYIILNFIRIFLFFLLKLFSMLIIKHLNQVYLICATSIFYFSLRLLRIIFSLILKDDNSLNVKIYELIAELFSIFGILFYLELIELNFCRLNYDVRKNIMKRSLIETNIKEEYNDEDDNNPLDDNNDDIVDKNKSNYEGIEI